MWNRWRGQPASARRGRSDRPMFSGWSAVPQLTTIPDSQRIIEIAVLDTLSLDNGVARNRTLLAGAQTALKAQETGDLAERVEALEAILKRQGTGPATVAGDGLPEEAAGEGDE